MPAQVPGIKAGGNIYPHRFIAIGSGDHVAIQAVADDIDVIGVSQPGSHDAPIPQNTSGYAAISGDQVYYRPFGSEALLEVGTGGATRGVPLMPDANGKGVAATSGKTAFFLPFESASAGEFVRGVVTSGQYKA